MLCQFHLPIIKQIFRVFSTAKVLIMTTPTIYRDVNSILAVLDKHKEDNQEAVAALLGAYNNALKLYNEDVENNGKSHKFPLVILEGLDGCGKSTISKILAKKIKAIRCTTPPQSISTIRNLFDDHPQLRTAYYSLGNYIAALECAVHLKKTPVLMDRFWHSTAAYALAQAVHDFPNKFEIPPPGDSFYNWPCDLFKPSMVIFLNVDEEVRLERLSRRKEMTSQESLLKSSDQFRNNVIMIYKNMVDPTVEFIDSNSSKHEVVSMVENKIKHLL